MRFEASWKKLLGVEGEWSDHPDDSGGKTRWGVTERLARAYGYTGDMRELPLEEAMRIAKAEFWDKMSLDEVGEIYPRVAHELFDSGYNVGSGRPPVWLQRCLNALNYKEAFYSDLRVDGQIGPKTLAALAAYKRRRGSKGEEVLFQALNSLLGSWYLYLAERREKDESFIYGWFLHRVQ